ncbi:MAG: hypothetical protein KDK29_17920 [Sedimentitalea sp.]|nr:hypothetical protein [Sedimentitalea sp.]
MKPGFALSLSVDGISLLHRAAGGWRRVGDVSLETRDLTGALADLRARALRLDPDGLACKLVIPNQQIRYLSIETGDADDEELIDLARAALEGATPYPVADLAFDLSTEGDQIHIAAVARETLAEAEAFAVENGFNPVSFVAIPGENPFLGEPNFGPAEHARTLPEGTRVEPDGIAVVVIGDARIPAAAPEAPADAEPAPDALPETAADTASHRGAASAMRAEANPEPMPDGDPEAPPEPAPAAAGFASRRGKTGASAVAPPLAGARRADTDAPAPPKPKPPAPPVRSPGIAPQDAAVTAPGLDLPETREDSASALRPPAAKAKPAKTMGVAGFLTRRGQKRAAPATPAVQITRTAPPPMPRPEPGSPEEAERMTIFGARQPRQVGGKPRHLGLILTVVLLLFLAVVGAWAAIFQESSLSRLLFGPRETVQQEVAPEPGAEDPALLPDAGAVAPEPPGAEPPTSALQPPETGTPAPGALTPSDEVVLDALRNPEIAALLNPDAAEARYAATGIWQQPPLRPEPPASAGIDDLYIASIDPTDLSQDAVALPPAASLAPDLPPAAPSSPAAAGTAFDLDARGLVTPSPGGTLSPEGILVHLGRPPVVPPERPAPAEAAPVEDSVQDYLAGLRPKLRPENLAELSERQQLGGLSLAELGGMRPKARPDAVVAQAAEAARQAEIARQDAEAAALAAEVARKQAEDAAQAGTDQAIATSPTPAPRPSDFASLVRKAERSSERSILPTARQQFGRDRNSMPDAEADSEPEPDSGSVAPRTVKPSAPSTATVARQATLDNAINLRQMNLIGVYGTPANRRALVRLSNGRYKKVKVGDSIDGGRIVAIGDSELRYQKGGRNLTLKIPSG